MHPPGDLSNARTWMYLSGKNEFSRENILKEKNQLYILQLYILMCLLDENAQTLAV